MKQFRLSQQDKDTLISWGYLPDEFSQIEDATNMGNYETNTGKSVTWETAKKLLGNREFLSGISRAAFHWSAYRCNYNRAIYMDFSKFFK